MPPVFLVSTPLSYFLFFLVDVMFQYAECYVILTLLFFLFRFALLRFLSRSPMIFHRQINLSLPSFLCFFNSFLFLCKHCEAASILFTSFLPSIFLGCSLLMPFITFLLYLFSFLHLTITFPVFPRFLSFVFFLFIFIFYFLSFSLPVFIFFSFSSLKFSTFILLIFSSRFI